MTMERHESTALHGMKQITEYAGFNEKKVRRLMESHQFPAYKIDGEYLSDKVSIDNWRRGVVSKMPAETN